jgi:hypothetical protein
MSVFAVVSAAALWCANTDQRAFVITLTRAGEDNARFQLTDTESTFASFAGADYDLQVRLTRFCNGTTANAATRLTCSPQLHVLLLVMAWY